MNTGEGKLQFRKKKIAYFIEKPTNRPHVILNTFVNYRRMKCKNM